MKMSSIDWVVWILVVVGAINWGLVGFTNVNLVETLFGLGSALTQVVYILIGLSGLYMLWGLLSKKR